MIRIRHLIGDSDLTVGDSDLDLPVGDSTTTLTTSVTTTLGSVIPGPGVQDGQ